MLPGLCEIGGVYLIWLGLKEGKPLWNGLVGALIFVTLIIALPIPKCICKLILC
ncbi:hypothetical protein [Pedobacter sp. V48]|uniref:hypothetical protein n=1 Tax=Pedobacter sp. V48 TaxID=509635 RepID=UPI0004B88539